jgi:hypothetical protein
MRVPVRKSEKMNTDKIENRLIRVPLEIRQQLNIDIHEFVTLDDKFGGKIALQVEDLPGMSIGPAYVGSNVYNLLDHSVINNIKRVEGITLGCDPELFIIEINSGRVVRPSELMQNGKGQLGYDGTLLELRPTPSINECTLVNNIGHLIMAARKMLDISGAGHDLMLWSASAHDGYMAGFHLHFGLPYGLLGYKSPVKKIARLMTYVMDYYVGTLCVVIEGDKDFIRRSTPMIKYGKPGGYCLDNKTYEYRLPGGSFLRHPKLSTGLISLGATVIEDLVSRISIATDNFSNFGNLNDTTDIMDLYPNLPDIKTLFKLLTSCNTQLARKQINHITDDIKSMVGYCRRSGDIEDFIHSDGRNFSNITEHNWLDKNNSAIVKTLEA